MTVRPLTVMQPIRCTGVSFIAANQVTGPYDCVALTIVRATCSLTAVCRDVPASRCNSVLT
jgi:hypothetical protein